MAGQVDSVILSERPLGRVSKDGNDECARWFETREDALLTMRLQDEFLE